MVLLIGSFNHGLKIILITIYIIYIWFACPVINLLEYWGVVDFLNATKRFLPDDSVSVLSALEQIVGSY